MDNKTSLIVGIFLVASLYLSACSTSDAPVERVVTVVIQITATRAPTDPPTAILANTTTDLPTATKTKKPTVTSRPTLTPPPTSAQRASSSNVLPTSTPAKQAKPTKTLKPTKAAAGAAAAVCNCIGPDLDCADLKRKKPAQDCYNYCKSLGYGDIFKLDRDGDGRVCESLP
jgi:hypothetical protein